MNLKSLNYLTELLFNEISQPHDLDEIRAIFAKHQVTQEEFDGFCIYFFTRSIRLTDGYICGCDLQPLCRASEATGMKPSEKTALYIQTRLFKCSDKNLERVKNVLGIDGTKGV